MLQKGAQTNTAHMLSQVRDLKHPGKTGQGSVLQGWPPNPCCRAKHLKYSEVLWTILIIRIFTVLSLDWEQNKLDLFLHLTLAFIGRIGVLYKDPTQAVQIRWDSNQKEAGLSQALCYRLLWPWVISQPVHCHMHHCRTGRTANSNGHKCQNTPVNLGVEDFSQAQRWFLKSLTNSGLSLWGPS